MRRLSPVADYHAHLFSFDAISRLYPTLQPPDLAIPEGVRTLLARRADAWNNVAQLADLYTEDAVTYRDRNGKEGWITGRRDVAAYIGTLFGTQHRIVPMSFRQTGAVAVMAAHFGRDIPTGTRYFGEVLLHLVRDNKGVWRIESELGRFPGPRGPEPNTAEQLIAQLDAAGIERAVVLSTGYWFSRTSGEQVPDERSKLAAENDYVAAQTARFPGRLVAFCSVNPLKDYAVEEIQRCSSQLRVKGLKLHLGDSEVNLLDSAHVSKLKQVFKVANDRRLAIVVHVMTGDSTYGRKHSEVFLNQVLPVAQNIPIQIAHMAGSGPGYNSDEAFAVFAAARKRGDVRMKNVFVDVATVVTLNTGKEELALVAQRLREFGLSHVLYASDTPASLDITPESGWLAFRRLPLSDAEFRVIAENATSYSK